jgi:hypothetical protein
MTTPTTPKPLKDFEALLRSDPEITQLLKEEDVTDLSEFIESGALAACLNDYGSLASSIDAWGADDAFQIEIYRFGPIYWIRALEFDDIGYFGSQRDAERHAAFEYSGLIEAYEENAYGSDEDDEDEDDEEEEEVSR